MMTITTLSSREFNQDSGKAKRATQNGPVFITDRGRPAHVLLTIEDYRKIMGQTANLVELLAFDGDLDDEAFLEEARLGDLTRPVDLN